MTEMKQILVLLTICGCALASSLDTKTLVERHNYPFEEHNVTTSDGYILGVHRIPYSPKMGPALNRPVVFLLHGLLSSSSDWVVAGPKTGLAFLLSDLGYDVWMGNARGNIYSRLHEKRSPLFQPFWNFDWHEIGLYDIPNMIDYILSHTGEEQLDFVGHSQGTTAFFVSNSLLISLGSKIKSAHMLAPVARMKNMKSTLSALAAPLLGQPNGLVSLLGSMEFRRNNFIRESLGGTVCQEKYHISALCHNLIFLIAGFNPDNLNKTLIPELTATTPAGSSVNQVLHYLQEYNSGLFREFDYGILLNLEKYGSKYPPNYAVSKIRAPMYFYYSDNDVMVHPDDVNWLINEIPKEYIKGVHRVADPQFTHIDFIFGLNVKEQVYNQLIHNLGQ